MAAVTTRFATCPAAPHGEHFWGGPYYASTPGYKLTHPSGLHLGTAICRYCGVLITDAVTIAICPECKQDLPTHAAKCKVGRAT